MPGVLEAIWIKRAKQGPMDPVESAQAKAGSGLVDNANQGGYRQVTLISVKGWDEVCAELDAQPDPRLRRANLFVSGVDLADSSDKILRIGDCRIHVRGRTRPCRLMEESFPGLQKALEPNWRCGAYGQLLDDAELRVGDEVEFVAG